MFWSTKPKVIRISGTLQNWLEQGPVETSILFSWHLGKCPQVFFVDSDSKGRFKMEIDQSDGENYLWIRTASPWCIAANAIESKTWYRQALDPSHEGVSFDSERNTVVDSLRLFALPKCVDEYFRRNAEQFRKRESLATASFSFGIRGNKVVEVKGRQKGRSNCFTVPWDRLQPLLERLTNRSS